MKFTGIEHLPAESHPPIDGCYINFQKMFTFADLHSLGVRNRIFYLSLMVNEEKAKPNQNLINVLYHRARGVFMDKRILVIEDEPAIQKILFEPLVAAGYEVTTASDGLEGINAFHRGAFDLILLDIMLPKIDGYAVCEMIRQESNIPIILLTALDAEDDQIKGFDLLADDYITKPFSVRLVLKRVEALLRRTAAEDDAGVIRYKEITLNETERQVFVSENEIVLTHLEFEILLLLMKNPGRVFSRDDLLNLVWGYEYVADEKGVNFHIMNLRKKLNVGCIETVRGVGYKIAKENP